METDGTDAAGPAVRAVITYHDRSKHRPERYAPGPGGLDWATQPAPFRTFPGTDVLALPLRADGLRTGYAEATRGDRVEPRAVDIDGIGTLLELSFGISAWKSFHGNRWALRCNPSSGNLHPTECYVVSPGVPGLAAGVYHYASRDHALERRAALDACHAPGGVLVGLSGIAWREAWKYGMRAFRYCQHDCGHALAALAYGAAALGWRARRIETAGDADIAALLGLDRDAEFPPMEREMPEVLVWVGSGEPDAGPRALAEAGRGAAWAGRASPLSPAHVAWPDIDRVAAASVRPSGVAWPAFRDRPLPRLGAPASVATAATVIRQRRSAVDFDGVTRIDSAAFTTMLDALMPRPGLPPWTVHAVQPAVHPVLFVHRVDGLEPGLYLLVRDPAAEGDLRATLRAEFEWLDAGLAHLPLYRLAPHDLRAYARSVSCHQDIAADSAFSLAFVAQFDEQVAAGPWRYRELFREAGLLGHVLYLEAEAAGVRATGIGCYFDDEVHRLLGVAGHRYQSLYHFTVGGPVEDARIETLPPYAHLTGR